MSRSHLYETFRQKGFKVGAEIGVGTGVNAVAMFQAIPGLKLFLVDPWETPRRSERFQRRVRKGAMEILLPYWEKITLLHMASEEAAPKVEDGSLDFVYIDGDHRYDAVMLDIILWGRKVKSGGILSGHDYVKTRKHGVKRAVDDYSKYHRISLHDYRGNWFWGVI